MAIALAAMMAWTHATAVDVHILGFRFDCTTPDGEVRKPKFGDVGGIFFTDLPKQRKACLDTINRMIYSCNANTTFISHELNRKYASCLPVFEKQAFECAAHFDRQRSKCDAGSEDVNREAHASDTGPVEDDVWDTGEDDSSAGDAWKPWEDEAASDASDNEHWVDVTDPDDEGYEPDDGDYGEVAGAQATAVDVRILGFRFACTTPDGEVRKPKFGDVDGTFFTDLPKQRKACLDTINRMIYSCNANTTFISHELNRKFASCLPVFEKQAYECAAHFDRQRSKCDAGSEDVNREAHASDIRPVEDDAWDTGEDGSSADEAWNPWENESDSDASNDEHWVEVTDPKEGHEPDDGDDSECKDVWADCPVDAYLTKEQLEGAWQTEIGVNFYDPLADAVIDPDDEKLGYESYDAIGENRDAGDSARDDYERALAGLLNEDSSSTAQLYSAPDDDYLAVLKKMDARAEEKARLEAEKARLQAEMEAAEAAAQQELQATQGDGSCPSTPASGNYLRHAEQMLAQTDHISATSMTDNFLKGAFISRSGVGCMRKALPHETDACKTMLQSAISEFEQTYRSAIASAKGSAADSSYVEEFDRDPANSQFVRKHGIHISGASLDSCGD